MSRQPSSEWCFVCGRKNPAGLHLEFTDNGADEVVSEFVLAPVHQGYPGMAHGGILATILDETGGRVVLIDDPNALFVTAKLEVRYRKPVPIGRPLRAYGKLVRRSRRLVTAHAAISANGQTLAEADLLLTDVSGGEFSVPEQTLRAWRVDGE